MLPTKLSLAVLCLCSALAAAQTTTGVPATAPIQPFGVDIINQANLNIHISIPLYSKAGRKLPFNLPLNFDNTVWTPVENSSGVWNWQPISSLGVNQPRLSGTLTVFHTGSLPCNFTYPNYSYSDSVGTTHAFPQLLITFNSGCPGTTQGTVRSFDGLYTITADTTNGVTSFTDVSGNQILTSGNAQGVSGVGSFTDPDGNVFSENSNSGDIFTDTLGIQVLTATHTTTSSTYTYTGPNNTPEAVTLTASSFTVASNFGGCKSFTNAAINEYPPTAGNLLTSITLPDGTAYKFKYEATPNKANDTTGRLSEIDLPTGGSIKYTYPGTHNGVFCTGQTVGDFADGTLAGLTRQTSDGTWTYSRVISGLTTTIQDPAGNQTVLQTGNGATLQKKVYQGPAAGTPLETVTTCYNYAAAAPCSTLTPPNNGITPLALTVINQPNGGSQSQTVTYYGLYDQTINSRLPLPTEVDTYDFGATSPTQVKKITYASLGNILNRPSCVQVTVGTNSNACGIVTANTKSLTNNTYFADGNLKTTASWVSGTTFLNRSYTYYSNGLMQTATDVNSNQTSYTYQNCNNTPAYPSSVSSGGLTTSYVWDCNGGVITQVTDPNNQSTQYGYVGPPPNSVPDPFWRVLSVTDPLNNVTVNSYTPATSTTPATQETALNFPTTSPTSTVDALSTLTGSDDWLNHRDERRPVRPHSTKPSNTPTAGPRQAAFLDHFPSKPFPAEPR